MVEAAFRRRDCWFSSPAVIRKARIPLFFQSAISGGKSPLGPLRRAMTLTDVASECDDAGVGDITAFTFMHLLGHMQPCEVSTQCVRGSARANGLCIA